MSEEITEAVVNGVEWLNEILPVNWWEFIDLETLNMESEFDCVLAQLSQYLIGETGDYTAVVQSYPQLDGVSCGFDHWSGVGFFELQMEWIQMIRNLRAISGTDLQGLPVSATMTGEK